MSYDDNILLKLRREFSGQEKYRLFLQQLNRLESELKRERELNTQLIKDRQELKKLNNELKQANNVLKAEIGEYTATDTDKKYVRVKAYNKLQKSHQMWETRFWEQNAELQQLKQSQPTGDESL